MKELPSPPESEVCQAHTVSGILAFTGVKRLLSAQGGTGYFDCCKLLSCGVGLQERLQQQREEAASNPEYGNSFKGQLSKDEKKARRKQILANIGALRPTSRSADKMSRSFLQRRVLQISLESSACCLLRCWV